MKGSLRFLMVLGVGIVLAFFLLPRLPIEGLSRVKLGTAILYDDSGREVGRINPSWISGSYIPADDGGKASYATVEVSYEIWLYDSDTDPSLADITIDLFKSGVLAGSYVDYEDETRIQNAIRQSIKGQWTYEGTSRKDSQSKDWKTSGTAVMKVTVDDLQNVYGIQPGQSAILQALVRVNAGELSASQRSSNTITFKLAEDPQAQLVIEKVTLGA